MIKAGGTFNVKNSDLTPVYREIADEIGFENTVKIYNQFKGQQVSFPQRLYAAEYVIRYIKENKGNMSVKELAKKFGYTERRIRQFMNGEVRCEDRKE